MEIATSFFLINFNLLYFHVIKFKFFPSLLQRLPCLIGYVSTFSRYEIYKSLEVSVGKLSIAIEERLMLKLLHFIGYGLALSQRDTELLTEAKVRSHSPIIILMKREPHFPVSDSNR